MIFILIILSTLFFVRFGDTPPLFDWDEINFAESAREMIVSEDYLRVQIDFKPFHEKPPLFIWLQVISMKIFGVNEYAARFPNSIIGLISMIVIFLFGKKVKDIEFATYWVAAYAGSLLPAFYFFSGIIDPLFNILMFGSLIQIYFYYKNDQAITRLFIASILIALAVLTKGPVAILLVGLTWFLFSIFNKDHYKINYYHFLIFIVIGILPYFVWYTKAYGGEANIFYEFIEYHLRLLTTGDAGHSGPFFYHFPVLLFGAFPASIIAFKGFKRYADHDHVLFALNLLLLIVVLLIFSIVKTKIIHYSSLAYFPITFFAARAIWRSDRIDFKRVIRVLIFVAFLFQAAKVAFIGLPNFALDLINYVKDDFTAEILRTPVDPEEYSQFFGGSIFLGTILVLVMKDKKRAFIALFVLSATFMYNFSSTGSNLVAAYTQNTTLDFYRSKKDEDCYIEPLGFKTYAHYFYSNRKAENTAAGNGMKYKDFLEELLEGKIDKPAYFVTKSTKYQKYLDQYDLELLEVKNGWAFMRRFP